MLNTILGFKQKMGQKFIEGFKIPTTTVVAGPCVVTQVRKNNQSGNWSVQLGYGSKKIKHTSKPLQGHLKAVTKDNLTPRHLKEFSLKEEPNYKVGDIVKVSDIFKLGDKINVVGTSKGKGFAGGVKRWNFKGGPKTHGQSDRHRGPGSIGQTTTPGRVLKGKHMAGRMGSAQVTVRNLHIVSISPEESILEISGSVPGIPGSLVTIKRISAGSLADLEHEVVAQVVEGEAPIEKNEGEAEAPKENKETEKKEGEPNA